MFGDQPRDCKATGITLSGKSSDVGESCLVNTCLQVTLYKERVNKITTFKKSYRRHRSLRNLIICLLFGNCYESRLLNSVR